jgi:hypothetical protein
MDSRDAADNACAGLSDADRARLAEAATILLDARGIVIRTSEWLGGRLRLRWFSAPGTRSTLAPMLYGGYPQRALRVIRACVLLMPGEMDLYFRVADNSLELAVLASAELKPNPR